MLADDDVLLREGLASLLARLGFDVAGQAKEDGVQLLAVVRATKPDVAIVDVRGLRTGSCDRRAGHGVIREELAGDRDHRAVGT